MNLALNCWLSQCYNTTILTAKLFPYYFTYLLFNLQFMNRTITRFITDDKVVYQRVRRETRLYSDNSRARRRLKHLSWRSRWIILCTLEQRIAVSCEISRADRCLFGLSSLLSTGSSTVMCQTRSTAAWLPDNCTYLVDSLQQTVDASNFQPLSGNSLSVLYAQYRFDR